MSDNKKNKSKKAKKAEKPCKPCRQGTPVRDKRGRCRCYADEYVDDHKSKEAKADRNGRTVARGRLKKWYKARGKKVPKDHDVHHVDGNPQNNSEGNTRLVDASSNRGMSNKTRTA